MTKRKQYRCEHCLNLFYRNEMQDFDGLHLCKANCLRHYTHERCEGCFRLYERETVVDGQCYECRNPKKNWFAAYVYISESKVAKNIREHFRNKMIQDQLGKIFIPKIKEARKTLNRYDVYDADNNKVGIVSAEDSEDALFKAKAQYGKSRKRTLYRPEATNDFLERVEKVKEGRKVYYQAMSNTGRMMGRVSGYRSQKKAEEALQKLYGKKDIDANPRQQSANPVDVKYVKLAEAGGKVVVQNKKSMSGYIIVQLWNDPQNFVELSKCRGIHTILPYAEQIPERRLGKIVTDGDKTFVEYPTSYENLPPAECAITEEEVERLRQAPLKEVVTAQTVTPGEIVDLKATSFSGMKARVVSYDPKTMQVTVAVKMWGRETTFPVSITDIRK